MKRITLISTLLLSTLAIATITTNWVQHIINGDLDLYDDDTTSISTPEYQKTSGQDVEFTGDYKPYGVGQAGFQIDAVSHWLDVFHSGTTTTYVGNGVTGARAHIAWPTEEDDIEVTSIQRNAAIETSILRGSTNVKEFRVVGGHALRGDGSGQYDAFIYVSRWYNGSFEDGKTLFLTNNSLSADDHVIGAVAGAYSISGTTKRRGYILVQSGRKAYITAFQLNSTGTPVQELSTASIGSISSGTYYRARSVAFTAQGSSVSSVTNPAIYVAGLYDPGNSGVVATAESWLWKVNADTMAQDYSLNLDLLPNATEALLTKATFEVVGGIAQPHIAGFRVDPEDANIDFAWGRFDGATGAIQDADYFATVGDDIPTDARVQKNSLDSNKYYYYITGNTGSGSGSDWLTTACYYNSSTSQFVFTDYRTFAGSAGGEDKSVGLFSKGSSSTDPTAIFIGGSTVTSGGLDFRVEKVDGYLDNMENASTTHSATVYGGSATALAGVSEDVDTVHIALTGSVFLGVNSGQTYLMAKFTWTE